MFAPTFTGASQCNQCCFYAQSMIADAHRFAYCIASSSDPQTCFCRLHCEVRFLLRGTAKQELSVHTSWASISTQTLPHLQTLKWISWTACCWGNPKLLLLCRCPGAPYTNHYSCASRLAAPCPFLAGDQSCSTNWNITASLPHFPNFYQQNSMQIFGSVDTAVSELKARSLILKLPLRLDLELPTI